MWVFVVALVNAVFVLPRLVGFAAQKPANYEHTTPNFDIRERLNGTIACEGVIYGPFGRVVSKFVATFYASWDGNTGTMKEEFTYDSGKTQTRQWTLQVDANGKISATAPDLVGTGHGQQSGGAVQLKYRIKLQEDAGGHVLNATDWMYLMENGVIMNRSQMRKFGIKVAELVAVMRPVDGENDV
ncbi:MAG: DUF3833 domain-containing protein [Planktomarina sp.]